MQIVLFMSCVNRNIPVGVAMEVGRREGGLMWQDLVPVGVQLRINQQCSRAQCGGATSTPGSVQCLRGALTESLCLIKHVLVESGRAVMLGRK